MKTIGVLVLMALAGCATASHTAVTALGGERYMVGYQQRGGFDSWSEVKVEAVKLANAHCATMNKTAEVLNTEETGARGWTPMNVEVTFTCH